MSRASFAALTQSVCAGAGERPRAASGHRRLDLRNVTKRCPLQKWPSPINRSGFGGDRSSVSVLYKRILGWHAERDTVPIWDYPKHQRDILDIRLRRGPS